MLYSSFELLLYSSIASTPISASAIFISILELFADSYGDNLGDTLLLLVLLVCLRFLSFVGTFFNGLLLACFANFLLVLIFFGNGLVARNASSGRIDKSEFCYI